MYGNLDNAWKSIQCVKIYTMYGNQYNVHIKLNKPNNRRTFP